jgi:hypothetical protein
MRRLWDTRDGRDLRALLRKQHHPMSYYVSTRIDRGGDSLLAHNDVNFCVSLTGRRTGSLKILVDLNGSRKSMLEEVMASDQITSGVRCGRQPCHEHYSQLQPVPGLRGTNGSWHVVHGGDRHSGIFVSRQPCVT